MKNRLKFYRHQLQMTQREFAAHINVHYAAYNRWERQHVQPSLDKLYDIWQTLKKDFPDIHIEDLLN